MALCRGSYLHVRRFVHRMANWQHPPAPIQQRVSGCCKQGDMEMGDVNKPDSIPIAWLVMGERHVVPQTVCLPMPYGSVEGGYPSLAGLAPSPAIAG
ncbi:hypothetical protein [Chitinimonas prasina]